MHAFAAYIGRGIAGLCHEPHHMFRTAQHFRSRKHTHLRERMQTHTRMYKHKPKSHMFATTYKHTNGSHLLVYKLTHTFRTPLTLVDTYTKLHIAHTGTYTLSSSKEMEWENRTSSYELKLTTLAHAHQQAEAHAHTRTSRFGKRRAFVSFSLRLEFPVKILHSNGLDVNLKSTIRCSTT